MNVRRHSGFSLMEVLLATSILLACLIVLGQMAMVGRHHAEDAESLTTAQLLSQAKLNEILAGAAPPASQAAVSIADMPGWSYEVDVQPLDQYDLVSVRVTVAPESSDQETGRKGKSCTLVRWMHAPELTAGQGATARYSRPEDEGALPAFEQDFLPNDFLDQ